MAYEVCVICPLTFLQKKKCVQWVWRDSFSSFLIYMLLCFQFRDGKVKEILLLLHKCVFEASGNSGVREEGNSLQKEWKRSLNLFLPSPVPCAVFVQTSGIISPKKNKTETSTTGLFAFLSLPLSFHLEQVHTSELLPKHNPTTFCTCKADTEAVAQPWVPLPRELAGCITTQERKMGHFSQGTYDMNEFVLRNLMAF